MKTLKNGIFLEKQNFYKKKNLQFLKIEKIRKIKKKKIKNRNLSKKKKSITK